ncbi:hypothetical protein F5144DRAFT_626404 [Chaetomium tenue]|uniref:Uncharacterized protein n=1 Tax=Chaetomium tenue TaxID=1854479 RepID=A0ACB7PJE7_9PEZI|nr:hypothetical protein F5144DRAFT_626404 [Chaetomium globosum]
MGSLLGAMNGHAGLGLEQVNGSLSTAQTKDRNVVSVEVVGVSSEPASPAIPATATIEVLLLAWLVVLLRTREDGQVSYEWAYKTDDADVEAVKTLRLSTSEILPDLHSTLEQVVSAIAGNISPAPTTKLPSFSAQGSFLLSTGSLSRVKTKTDQDESLLHLEVRLNDAPLEIRPVWQREDMLPFTVNHHVETLADTVQLCLANPSASIQSLLRPTAHDLERIWEWNNALPPTYDSCMHDLISERARKHPDKEAISSFDGSLTFAQVDRYSTFLAHLLTNDHNVGLHDSVPVCFEKSRWATVAVLAVMKTGATMVLMDPTLPLARLQNMAHQVGAKTILSSRKQHELSKLILPAGTFAVAEEETFATLSNPKGPQVAAAELAEVPPSAIMYIIFTSGSTGTPKGVKISHQTYTSSAIPRAKAVGYTENSRVLDFASYAFDVSIDSILLTLANGGCLCIPSDEDRLNDINGAMRAMRVNYAGITPSVARILDIDLIASLTNGLGLGGEAVSARDVNIWGQHARIVIGYGPCECTIGCTINSSAATGRDYISIGQGNGAAMWVVDPNDHDALMPVGTVGELLVEGPIVGQGYLNDPEKTAAAFIEDPSWLTAGHGPYVGRRGRLYKTGDLGRYDPDGSGGIVFVGRKDTQVKLRGQRVELGEIESQLRARLPAESTVIAEVIAPQGSSQGQSTLVAFVAPQFANAHGQEVELESIELSGELREAVSRADKEVTEVLPRYMVPTAYIPVNRIPTLISGKTDRKKLRLFGSTVDLRQMTANPGPSTETVPLGGEDRPLNDMEEHLRQAWGETLKLEPQNIRSRDNFFALGGDSLAAMRLVSACRDRGLDLSVINTFGNPTLSAMAAIVTVLSDSQTSTLPKRSAFCLIPQPPDSAIAEASQVCGTESTNIEDIYPCTPTQESLFTFSLKSTEPYIAQRVATIPSHITLDDWKRAWNEVVAVTPILRSRLVQLGDHTGLDQVVLKGSIQWRYSSSELAQYLEHDRNERMEFGQSLARYAVVEPRSSPAERYMVWTLHHAVYDGWSEPLLLEKVRDALHHISQPSTPNPLPTMGDFVQHIRALDTTTTQSFWRTALDNATGPQFPRVPSRDFIPTPNTTLERYIPLPHSTTTHLPFTLATLIRGAWALVAAQHTLTHDIIFGETLTGRDIPLPGVETITGPLIATVPMRVRIPPDRATCTVAAYLRGVAEGVVARTPFQHVGMQHIRKVSRDAQYACEAPMGLVIQPVPEGGGVVGELGFGAGDVVREALHFNPYPLMLACGVEKGGGGFRVCASFDAAVVGVREMERVLAQLETVCGELARDVDRGLDQVLCVPAGDLDQIWEWNRNPPLALDGTSGRFVADAGLVEAGSVYNPRAAIPWVCDVENPSLLAPIGCPGELWLEAAFLTGDGVVDSPAWMVAGSSQHPGRTGKAQPTGNIVKLQEDGSMVFVGQKDTNTQVNGHGTAPAEVEIHLAKYLPPSVNATTVLASQGPARQGLLVFMERPEVADGESPINVIPEEQVISSGDFTTMASATAPATLVSALKKFDKFAQNSLASHLVPSAYLIINKLPTNNNQVDRVVLQQLASQVPERILDQLRDGLQAAWKVNPSSEISKTSVAEDILRSSWATVLGLELHQIDTDDNFFRLGGDSVLAMKLVSRLRSQGHGLTVGDIFRHMRLGDAAKVMKMNKNGLSGRKEPAKKTLQEGQGYQPFSALGSMDMDQFVTEVVRPQLADANWTVQDVYPVTDSQALDIRATLEPPRTSVQYTFLYSDKDGFDRGKLSRAYHKLIQAHDILRTVFIEHGSTFLQVVLKDLDIAVAVEEADQEDLGKFVHGVCTSYIESDNFRLGSPFLHIFLAHGKDGQECLAIGLSHAQYDGVSLPLLLRDLDALYTGSPLTPSSPFSTYITQSRSSPAHTQALTYWNTLLATSTPSILPNQTRPSPSPTTKAIFHTTALPTIHPPPTTTTATLLTAAWALVLARRLHTTDITFGSITSGRASELTPGAEHVVGPCYQFTPVRVPFQKGWTAGELLGFVQRQGAEGLAWDFVGVGAIAGRVGWEEWGGVGRGVFFDSVVHHQDWEDFDVMPFGGGECKVDVWNPHGDAAYPLKVVSFFKGGELNVGVVGSEADVVFVDEVLAELAGAVRELVEGTKEGLLARKCF